MTTYYISPTGSDNNDGLSELNPWQHLEKLTALQLRSGDRVLLQGEATFSETIDWYHGQVQGPDAPVILGSYGAGKATLTVRNASAILCGNCTGLTIRDLILRGECDSFGHSGIVLAGGRNYRLENMEISGFSLGGIETNSGGQDWLHDLMLIDCRFTRNCNGTHFAQVKGLKLLHCLADRNDWLGDVDAPLGGYGFGVYWCRGVEVEQCVAEFNGLRTVHAGGHGGFIFQDVDALYVQLCLAEGNGDPNGMDGQGFCFYGTHGARCSHLLSQGNLNGGYSFFQDDWCRSVRDVVVSESVSLDDVVGIAVFQDVANCYFLNSPMVRTHGRDGGYRKCLDVWDHRGGVLGLWGNAFSADQGAILAEVSTLDGRPLPAFMGFTANDWPDAGAYRLNNVQYATLRHFLTAMSPVPLARDQSKPKLVGKKVKPQPIIQHRPGMRLTRAEYGAVVADRGTKQEHQWS